jgi:hypothetical protein
MFFLFLKGRSGRMCFKVDTQSSASLALVSRGYDVSESSAMRAAQSFAKRPSFVRIVEKDRRVFLIA